MELWDSVQSGFNVQEDLLMETGQSPTPSCSFHMGVQAILPRGDMMQEIAEATTHFLRPQKRGKETADYFLILKINWEENHSKE